MSLLQEVSGTIIGATNQVHTKYLYAEKSVIEGDSVVGGNSTVGGDLTVGGDVTVAGTSHSVVGISWVNNYFNLTNNVQNFLPFDTVTLNNASSVFSLVNSGVSGATGARVFVQLPGLYEVISQMHFFDLQANNSLIVRLASATTASGAMAALTLLSDEKFVENSDDRTLNASVIVSISVPTYFTISVEPTGGAPFPSNTFNTPTRFWIKKL